MPPPHQGYRRKAFCKIVVDGDDVTARMDPYLLSVTVRDKETEIDEASIELDDRDARLAIPPDDKSVVIYLGWEPRGPRIPPTPPDPTAGTNIKELPWEGGLFMVFNGWVDSVESAFSRRGGGRKLFIEAKGQRGKSNVKTPNNLSMGEGVGALPITLQQFLEAAAAKAGVSVKISPTLATITRDHWAQTHESFMHLGAQIADQLGGKFKIAGNVATLVDALDGLDATGNPFGTVEAYWGINLISWRIKPFQARPQYKYSSGRFFDDFLAEWQEVLTNIPGNIPFGGSLATAALPNPAPNKGVGEQVGDSLSTFSQDLRGTGWAILNGEPLALGGRWLMISGARPGVDGLYTIQEAEHIYLRSGGYTTRCMLRQPRPNDDGYRAWQLAGAGTPGGFVGSPETTARGTIPPGG